MWIEDPRTTPLPPEIDQTPHLRLVTCRRRSGSAGAMVGWQTRVQDQVGLLPSGSAAGADDRDAGEAGPGGGSGSAAGPAGTGAGVAGGGFGDGPGDGPGAGGFDGGRGRSRARDGLDLGASLAPGDPPALVTPVSGLPQAGSVAAETFDGTAARKLGGLGVGMRLARADGDAATGAVGHLRCFGVLPGLRWRLLVASGRGAGPGVRVDDADGPGVHGPDRDTSSATGTVAARAALT
jgi:hypothetical protein